MSYSYSSVQFKIWKFFLGLYLAYYFLVTWKYSSELYSNVGVFSDLRIIRWKTYFPVELLAYDSVAVVNSLFISCFFCAVMIALGFRRKLFAFILYLITLWLYNRNSFTDSPEYSFINWLVLILVLIPSGEGTVFEKSDANWCMPKIFWVTSWLLLTLGYSYAAIIKLVYGDIFWKDGRALLFILNNDNSRYHWYEQALNYIPISVFKVLTWIVVIGQLSSPILFYTKKIRPYWWFVTTLVHLFLLIIFNVTQITLGMLLMHFFIFQTSWVLSVSRKNKIL